MSCERCISDLRDDAHEQKMRRPGDHPIEGGGDADSSEPGDMLAAEMDITPCQSQAIGTNSQCPDHEHSPQHAGDHRPPHDAVDSHGGERPPPMHQRVTRENINDAHSSQDHQRNTHVSRAAKGRSPTQRDRCKHLSRSIDADIPNRDQSCSRTEFRHSHKEGGTRNHHDCKEESDEAPHRDRSPSNDVRLRVISSPTCPRHQDADSWRPRRP